MGPKDYIDYLIKLIQIIASWPVAFFVLALIFRRELRSAIPELAKRLKKAPGGFEFGQQNRAFESALETGAEKLKDNPVAFIDFAKNQVRKLSDSRAETVGDSSAVLNGAIILWVDDKPLNNEYEMNYFRTLGAKIETAPTTKDGLAKIDKRVYDVIISDIHRVEDGQVNREAGYEFLDALKIQKIECPVIFYTSVKKALSASRASSAFGIATRSDELTRLVIDALRQGHA